MMSQSIHTYDFTGKRALIRVDFNVPFDEQFNVTDDTRIRAALPTIHKVLDGGGSVVLMSHLGRPKGEEDAFSLKHILDHLSGLLKHTVYFGGNCVGDKAQQLTANLEPGGVVLLENLRFHKEETAGDEFFAGQLAEHGDVYINDAFGTAHRAHASTAIIARFFPHDKLFGFVMEGEITAIDKVLHGAEHPVTAIIGGAKVSSKLSIIENLLPKVDRILIGGGMAFTFIKARGGKIGSSLVEDDLMEDAKRVEAKAKEAGVDLHLPTDAVAADAFDNNASTQVAPIDEISDGWMGLDAGPETITKYKEVIASSKTILWNGPMGVFEMSSFSKGTEAIARQLATVTEQGVFTLVGGGDSVAAINAYDLASKVSYVSTGGGAMLEYLEGKELPGIKAIRS